MTILSIGTRLARESDAAGISRVHETAWHHAYAGMIPFQALHKMVARRDTRWWARAIRHSTRILVLENDAEIVGYATIGSNRVTALPQSGEVYELYLLPTYQGVGLGRKLFLAAREELARMGMNSCVVWVLEDNDPAVRFYLNAGGLLAAEGSEVFSGKTLNKLSFIWN